MDDVVVVSFSGHGTRAHRSVVHNTARASLADHHRHGRSRCALSELERTGRPPRSRLLLQRRGNCTRARWVGDAEESGQSTSGSCRDGKNFDLRVEPR